MRLTVLPTALPDITAYTKDGHSYEFLRAGLGKNLIAR